MFVELQTPLIFGGLFGLAIVLLVFVYKFGTKQKSYEEAVAEQRQQTQALLGVTKPAKIKEKKGKKVKKSPGAAALAVGKDQQHRVGPAEVPENDTEGTTVVVHTTAAPPKKTTMTIAASNVNTPVNKNVETSIATKKNEDETPQSEQKSSKSKSSTNKESPKKSTSSPSKAKKSSITNEMPKKEQTPPEATVKEEPKHNTTDSKSVANTTNSALPNGIAVNVSKEKKKKKSESLALHQLASYANGQNVSFLSELVGKAELSKSDIQILIDALLNKLHEAPASISDWSEGKSDPIQKLKKQLTEKEKLLIESQEAVQFAQSKMRDIRTDQQTERSQLQQKIRSIDEMLQSKQQECTQLQMKLQHQQQTQLVAEQKLQSEIAALQMQHRNQEMCLSQTRDESEIVVSKVRQELDEVTRISQQLKSEVERITDDNLKERTNCQALIVQLAEYQNQLEQQRRSEELRIDVELKLEAYARQDNEQKAELARLSALCQQQLDELQLMERSRQQLKDELFHLQQQRADHDKIILKMHDGQQKCIDMQKENERNKLELIALHNQVTSSRNEINMITMNYEKQAAAYNEEIKSIQIELDEQKAKNDDLRQKNWKVVEALRLAELKINDNQKQITHNDKMMADFLKNERSTHRQFVERIFPTLKDELKSVKQDDFPVECEKIIATYLQNLSADAKQAEEQLQYYKITIDRSEEMLSKLQKQIEEEELNWQRQLSAKNVEKIKQLEEQLVITQKRLEDSLSEKRQPIMNDYENSCKIGASQSFSQEVESSDKSNEFHTEIAKENKTDILKEPLTNGESPTIACVIQEDNN